MNICANCRYVTHGEPPSSSRFFADYNWSCGHPKASSPVVVLDPVTGRKGFLCTNDLGGTYFTMDAKDSLPSCRKVNPDGACTLFEKSKWWGV